MARLTAIAAGLLGVLCLPLALSPLTSWLAVMVHAVVSLLCGTLALREGWAGRALQARAWGAYSVVVTGAVVGAVHLASWEREGWGWILPFLVVLSWAWITPVIAALAGALGDERRQQRGRAAVRARRAARA